MTVAAIFGVAEAVAADPAFKSRAVDPLRGAYSPENEPPLASATDPTAACYPLTRPKSRRRAVGKGGPPCTSNPTVQLTVQRTACAGDLVRVSWRASEERARVAIKGIACDLPSSGAVTVRADEGLTIRAVATICGIGPEASAAVEILPSPEITSFTAEHPTLAPAAATTLHFTYEHADAWSITGATPFPSEPLTGGGPFGGSVRAFFPSVPAEPVLTASGPCGAAVQALAIAPCPGAGPEVDFGQTDGRVAIGQTQRSLFLLSPETERWSIETDNGAFTPASGVRPASGEVEVTYTPARAGDMALTFSGENACGIRGIGGTQTVWNCAQPIIQSFTAGVTTLAVGQSTYVSYITQERHGEVGSVSSSLGNALGGPVHSPHPETRHTYTATHAGTDTVSVSVQTPCGPATASLQIAVH